MLGQLASVAGIGKVCRVGWRDVQALESGNVGWRDVAGIGKVCRVGWRDVAGIGKVCRVDWRDVAGRAGELWFFRLMKGLRMKNAGR